jgi:hypothetical protein
MRRILMSTKSEFSYPNNNNNSRNLAVKKLASFFEGVEDKSQLKENVTVSNKCGNMEKLKQSR